MTANSTIKGEIGCNPGAFRTDRLPADYFDLLPQSAVRYTTFPADLPHNSIWDFGRGPGKTIYAALCGELCASVSVRLYEYRPADGELRFCFDGGVETMANDRIIPPSKVHTSLHPTRDGKIIMATHTTARSPAHPYWMLDAYYTHLWEGYPGSHVIEWDPERREVKVLGIPVPRDSIYGAIYDAKYHALWFNTYLKGHLWRLDLASRTLRDFGQITEYGTYCLCKDRLGNIYTASRSGHVFHVNVDTCAITDLGVPAHAPEANPLWKTQRILAHHTPGPDGRLYVSFRFSDYLYAIDPATLKIERTACFLNDAPTDAPPAGQKGMAFDSQGVLWSVTMRPMGDVAWTLCHLYRWDILRAGAPQYMGLLGTPGRATACVSEMLMDDQDVLHLADTNHAEDPPGILAVDTRQLSLAEPRVKTRDVAAYLLFTDGASACPEPGYEQKAEKYRNIARAYDAGNRFLQTKANSTIRAKTTAVVRVWEMLARGTGAIAAMRWEDGKRLAVWCGPGGTCRLRIQDGKVVEQAHAIKDCPPRCPLPVDLALASLPWRQGRQYLAEPTSWTPWRKGQWLVGTRDGMLARFDVKSGKTFALGAVGGHGPVHQIAADAAHRSAFGVAGDPQDLGHVFHYDDERGLREVGRTFFAPPVGIVCSNTQPTTVALSPDGTQLAVGTIDALACVYIYTDVLID